MSVSLCNLLLLQAVVETCPDVNTQFGASVQSYQHGNVHQRPLLKTEAWSSVRRKARLGDVFSADLAWQVVTLSCC
jgi:hypothetical protein